MKTIKLDCSTRLFRLRLALALLALAFIIITARILQLFYSHATHVSHQISKNSTEDININRRDIIDRNGILLACSILAYDFYVQPSKMYNTKVDMEKMMEIFPHLKPRHDALLKAIYKKVKDAKARILIASNIFAAERQKILDNGIVGIHFEEKQRRIYPHNNTASHILGFLSRESIGITGVERFFQNQLIDSNEQKPLQLSIDINIQTVIRNIIASTMQKYKAKSATGIIMKVNTGEIVAAVSLPDFDSNHAGLYSNNEIFNRFSLGVYELGSVFKIFFAALTAEQNLSWSKHYDTSTPVKIDKYVIHNFRDNRTVPTMTIPEILRYSSNVGCARAIEDLPKGAQQKMFTKLGFREKVPIELHEKGYPILPKTWNTANLTTSAYGHGIAVSPLHFVAASAALLHEGVLIHPTILKVQMEQDVKKGERVISMKNVYKLRSLLRDVVVSGTGRNVAAYKYDVGGKSGTAIQVSKGKYHSQKVITSFFAAVPIKQPQYIFYMTLEEPQSSLGNNNLTGSNTVAPAVSKMISLTGPMLGIPNLMQQHKPKKP